MVIALIATTSTGSGAGVMIGDYGDLFKADAILLLEVSPSTSQQHFPEAPRNAAFKIARVLHGTIGANETLPETFGRFPTQFVVAFMKRVDGKLQFSGVELGVFPISTEIIGNLPQIINHPLNPRFFLDMYKIEPDDKNRQIWLRAIIFDRNSASILWNDATKVISEESMIDQNVFLPLFAIGVSSLGYEVFDVLPRSSLERIFFEPNRIGTSHNSSVLRMFAMRVLRENLTQEQAIGVFKHFQVWLESKSEDDLEIIAKNAREIFRLQYAPGIPLQKAYYALWTQAAPSSLKNFIYTGLGLPIQKLGYSILPVANMAEFAENEELYKSTLDSALHSYWEAELKNPSPPPPPPTPTPTPNPHRHEMYEYLKRGEVPPKWMWSK